MKRGHKGKISLKLSRSSSLMVLFLILAVTIYLRLGFALQKIKAEEVLIEKGQQAVANLREEREKAGLNYVESLSLDQQKNINQLKDQGKAYCDNDSLCYISLKENNSRSILENANHFALLFERAQIVFSISTNNKTPYEFTIYPVFEDNGCDQEVSSQTYSFAYEEKQDGETTRLVPHLCIISDDNSFSIENNKSSHITSLLTDAMPVSSIEMFTALEEAITGKTSGNQSRKLSEDFVTGVEILADVLVAMNPSQNPDQPESEDITDLIILPRIPIYSQNTEQMLAALNLLLE